MQKFLYDDLYKIEKNHWWCRAKRNLCIHLINKFYEKKENNQLRILDIGCGTGKNIETLNKIGMVWGIDMALEAINFCKKRGLKRIKQGYAEDTGYRNNFFDIVVALDIIEHTDDKKTLREIKRILKPKGLLIMTLPAFKILWSGWDEVLQHKKRYNKKDLLNILTLYKFSPIRISYLYSFLFVPALIIRLIKSKIYSTNYPSDFQMTLPIFDWLFFNLYKLEKFLINYLDIPFGTSIFVISRNNKYL